MPRASSTSTVLATILLLSGTAPIGCGGAVPRRTEASTRTDTIDSPAPAPGFTVERSFADTIGTTPILVGHHILAGEVWFDLNDSRPQTPPEVLRDHPERRDRVRSIVPLGPRVLVRRSDQLVLYDLDRAAEVWRMSIARELSPRTDACEAEGGIVVRFGSTLIGFDESSGQTLWSHVIPGQVDELQVHMASAGTNVFVDWVAPSEARRLDAFDARTGRIVWSHELESGLGSQIDAAGDRVLWVAGDAEGLLLEAATGREIARIPAARSGRGVRMSGNDGFILVITDSVGANEERDQRVGLLAVDLGNGAVRWSIATHRSYYLGASIPEVVGDVVICCFGDGVLYAFERASGRPAWGWGVGRCPRLYAPTDRSDAFVATLVDGDVALFRRDALPVAPAERVTIEGVVTLEGQPQPGWLLSESSTEVRTDEQGRYRLVTEARGWIDLVLVPPTPVFDVQDELIVLDGRTNPYRVDFGGAGWCVNAEECCRALPARTRSCAVAVQAASSETRDDWDEQECRAAIESTSRILLAGDNLVPTACSRAELPAPTPVSCSPTLAVPANLETTLGRGDPRMPGGAGRVMREFTLCGRAGEPITVAVRGGPGIGVAIMRDGLEHQARVSGRVDEAPWVIAPRRSEPYVLRVFTDSPPRNRVVPLRGLPRVVPLRGLPRVAVSLETRAGVHTSD